MVRTLRSRPLDDARDVKNRVRAIWKPPWFTVVGLQVADILAVSRKCNHHLVKEESVQPGNILESYREYAGRGIHKNISLTAQSIRKDVIDVLEEPLDAMYPTTESQQLAGELPSQHVSSFRDDAVSLANNETTRPISTSFRSRSASYMSSIPSSTPPPEPVKAAKSTPVPATDPDLLTERDLPPPFLPVAASGYNPSNFPDTASYLLASSFAPIPPPHAFVNPLISHPSSSRSTDTLLRLAQNTFEALKAWQDEYLLLDAKTAPHHQPPRKAATGGRLPLDATVWEAIKEADADLWRKGMDVGTCGMDRASQALQISIKAGAAVDGRGVRRRKRHALEGLGMSEDDAGGIREKRSRKPVTRFDAGMNVGVGGRKRRRLQEGAEGFGVKRGRGGRLQALRRIESHSLLPPLAEESATATEDDDEWQRGSTPSRSSARYTSTSHGGINGTGGDVRGAAGAANQGISYTSLPSGNFFSLQSPSQLTQEGYVATGLGSRQRVKSEKRSVSMTAWWAARKQKVAEEKIKELRAQGVIPVNIHGGHDHHCRNMETSNG